MKLRGELFMKRFIVIALFISYATGLFAASWADGIYFAAEDTFAGNGWKYHTIITVNGGKIVKAQWNATNINGGMDKVSLSKAGKYPMVAKGGAKADWHIQASKAEQYLLETQDPKKISYNDDKGHTDAISGASIHVIEFFSLAEKALSSAPVKKGMYMDGYPMAEEQKFSSKSGWKYFAQFTVVNGTVVQVNWNGKHKDGGDSKKIVSEKGEYGMKAKGGAQSEWFKQASITEEYFLKVGGEAPKFPDNYHTDAITGATIGVKPLWSLAEMALK